MEAVLKNQSTVKENNQSQDIEFLARWHKAATKEQIDNMPDIDIYKEYITDIVNRLNDNKVLRLIYFFIQGITRP